MFCFIFRISTISILLCSGQNHQRVVGWFAIISQVVRKPSELIPKLRLPAPRRVCLQYQHSHIVGEKIQVGGLGKRKAEFFWTQGSILPLWPSKMVSDGALALLGWYFCKEIRHFCWFRIRLMRELGGMRLPSVGFRKAQSFPKSWLWFLCHEARGGDPQSWWHS